MLRVERVEQLMKEVGPLADLLIVDAYPAQQMWHIAVDEDTEVFIELAASRRVLVVMAPVGKPEGGDLKTLYELLLRYAHAWSESNGLRLSLDEPSGRIWLSFDCAAEEISAAELGDLLTAFAAKLHGWREILSAHAKRHAEPQRMEALLGAAGLRG